VGAELAASGASHPVTAVLLNFRSYDTWLELVVLLVAAAGALQGRLQAAPVGGPLAGDPLLARLVTALVPLMMLAAGYLLQAGANAPGGAFQAGAVLGAALVLLHFAGRSALSLLSAPLVRVLLVLGAAFFAIAGIAGLALEDALLQYPLQHANAAILALEAAATASITVALAALVIGQMDG
jgi:multisubunit Na+/H+ antiporter MnhB subunit